MRKTHTWPKQNQERVNSENSSFPGSKLSRTSSAGSCHNAKGNKITGRNHNLIRLKEKAKKLLLSQQGIAHQKERCWDVEAVCVNIKQNMGCKRFMLRGKEKITTEIRLIAMAHNLKKFKVA